MSDWVTSGGMWLTGWPGREPLDPTGDPHGHAVASIGAIARWARVCGLRDELALDPAVCLFGRAGSRGWHRRGRVSVNGSCRLMRARGGWVAVNLARPDDVALLVALATREIQLQDVIVDDGATDSTDPWAIAELLVADTTVGASSSSGTAGPGRPPDWIDDATAMGLPIAVLGEATGGRPGVVVDRGPRPVARSTNAALDRGVPLVVDLSAMWAGPLCAKALGIVGCRVVKVESPSRPDAIRAGDPHFFDWLHAGHESVAIDLQSREGAALLRRLVGEADVVVESARPRAMAQLGIDPCAIVRESRCTWVSITGYGRTDPASSRVAFGDDAAVAGGLVAYDDDAEPVFCGDAIADPLTGLAAAAATLEVMARGGGLVDVAMAAVAADAAMPAHAARAVNAPTSSSPGAPHHQSAPAKPPCLPATQPAAPFGRDTDRVLAELHAST